jgi:hypothetical protein
LALVLPLVVLPAGPMLGRAVAMAMGVPGGESAADEATGMPGGPAVDGPDTRLAFTTAPTVLARSDGAVGTVVLGTGVPLAAGAAVTVPQRIAMQTVRRTAVK